MRRHLSLATRSDTGEVKNGGRGKFELFNNCRIIQINRFPHFSLPLCRFVSRATNVASSGRSLSHLKYVFTCVVQGEIGYLTLFPRLFENWIEAKVASIAMAAVPSLGYWVLCIWVYRKAGEKTKIMSTHTLKMRVEKRRNQLFKMAYFFRHF